jgi:hypothetical protein
MPIGTLPLLGPGTLTIGAAGAGQLNASAQVRSAKVVPTENVTRTDEKPVLSGEKLAASESAAYTFVLTVTFIQDPALNGVVDYSYDNAGVTKPFSFKPSNAAATKVEGNLRVMPIEYGGDVNDPSPESSVTFAIIGTPVFTPN